MPASAPSRAGIRPAFAVGLLLLAALAWACVFFWQTHKSPAQRHLEAGDEYARQGKSLEAVKEWQAAAQLDPQNAYAWQVLGQSYFDAKMWRRAIEAFIHLDRIQPDTPRIHSLLASSFLNIGDLDSAVKYAQEELKRNPDDIPALETVVAAQTRLGNKLEQRRCLQHLTELQPQNRDRLIALAELVIDDHDFAEGRSLAERILQLDASNAAAYAMRGICTFFIDGTPGGMAQAESDLLHSLRLHPGVYYCHLYLGKIYRRQGQRDKALAHLKEAVQLRPQKADAYYDLAAVYERAGQAAQAQAMRQKFQALAQAAEQLLHLKKRCETNPTDFALNRKVGLMALKMGDLPAAARYLKRADTLRPHDPEVEAALAQMAAQPVASNFAVSSATPPPNTGGP
jgi:tetratricopeptide (TPR) repeat protein